MTNPRLGKVVSNAVPLAEAIAIVLKAAEVTGDFVAIPTEDVIFARVEQYDYDKAGKVANVARIVLRTRIVISARLEEDKETGKPINAELEVYTLHD